MAVNFSESMTKENLMRAFAGESQARNRYTIAAERAEEDGMLTIAEIFRYTADQERAHAERFYDLLKELSGDTIHIDGSYPIDQQDTLPGLLRAAEHNEHEEFADVYQAFGNTAREEGFSEEGRQWMPLFDEYGVDVVLSAHLHSYRDRGHIRNFQRDASGPLYILTGVAGSVQYPGLWKNHSLDEYAAPQPETENYLVMEASDATLTFTGYLPSGEELHTVSIQK